MLHHGKPSADEARRVQRDLAELARFSGMADSLDQMERMCYLDAMSHFDQMDRETLSYYQFGDQVAVINVVSVDWNIVLRRGNEFYDRLVAAAREPTHAAREQALAKIDTELNRMATDLQSPVAWIAAAFKPSSRSDAVAALMLNFFLPAVGAGLNAQDRANTQLELMRLAAALAVFRAEQAKYPNKLDELVPGILDTLPVDVYNAMGFFYKRDGEGYLLYSAGENGADDGGSHAQWSIHKGQPLDKLDAAEAEKLQLMIPTSADDISIQVPPPQFELPLGPQPAVGP
jgi:hypothetical protein